MLGKRSRDRAERKVGNLFNMLSNCVRFALLLFIIIHHTSIFLIKTILYLRQQKFNKQDSLTIIKYYKEYNKKNYLNDKNLMKNNVSEKKFLNIT